MPTPSSFQNNDGTFFNEGAGGPVTTLVSAAAATIVMKNSQRALYVNNAATYATLTVKLPTRSAPGDVVELAFAAAVTTLTVQDGFGNAITGSPVAAAAHAAIHMRYISKAIGWVLWK